MSSATTRELSMLCRILNAGLPISTLVFFITLHARLQSKTFGGWDIFRESTTSEIISLRSYMVLPERRRILVGFTRIKHEGRLCTCCIGSASISTPIRK